MWAALLAWSVTVIPLTLQSASAADLTTRMAAVTEVVAGILSYARWPASAQASSSEKLQLCVVGPTEYADALLQSGNPASRWNNEVKRVEVSDTGIETICHAVYVGVISMQESQALFSRVGRAHILSISERDDSCTMGSMFCLSIQDEAVTFDINLDSVARSGIRVHPHVLKLGSKTSNP